MDAKSILVLGVGNLLLGDEGVGVHVAQRLQKRPLPPDVDVIDGGTVGFELIRFLEGREVVIIVDAFAADAPPGSIFRLGAEELLPESPRSSFVHQTGIYELLRSAVSLKPRPETIILGIVPASIEPMQAWLSVQLEQRMPEILESVMREANLLAERHRRNQDVQM